MFYKQLATSTYAFVFVLLASFLFVMAKAKAIWREKSPILKRNISKGMGMVWNSFSFPQFKIGSIANSLGDLTNAISVSKLRNFGSSAFLSTVNSALNLAGIRPNKRVPVKLNQSAPYKTLKQKKLEGLFESWTSFELTTDHEDSPPMIESPATSRKVLGMPSTFDEYASSISSHGKEETSPSPSQKSNNHRFGSITITPTSTKDAAVTSITATSLELDGLWAWEDEELGLCHDHDDQPSSPGKLQRKSGSAAAIHKTNTINQFHEMLQSSPELTSSLCQVLELSHWGMEHSFERYNRENGVRFSMIGEDLVVGFRGTCTVWDLIADLRIGTARGPHNAKVHKGFHGILKTIDREGIFLEEIKAAIKTNGAKRVIFSGYSLGGAVASLALLEHGDALLAEGVDVRAITFGCPRLADNKDLHKLPKRLTTKIIHTYIEGDPIPLSLTSFVPWHHVNYVHVGNAVVIENKGKGVTVREGKSHTADNNIKWWGIYTAPWSHHLTESYERFLQLQSIQLNFQLMMKRTPNFMSCLLKSSAEDCAQVAEDLERYISEQGGVLGTVDRLRSELEPLYSGGDLKRLPIKISQELIYIALVESFFKSLVITDNNLDMGAPGSPGKRSPRTLSSPRSPPKPMMVHPSNMITPETTPEYVPQMNVDLSSLEDDSPTVSSRGLGGSEVSNYQYKGMFGLGVHVDEAVDKAVDQDDRWSQPYLALAMMISGVHSPNDDGDGNDVSSRLFAAATTNNHHHPGSMHTNGAAASISAASISAGVVDVRDNDEGDEARSLGSPYDAETIAFFAQIDSIVFGASKDHDLIPSYGHKPSSSSTSSSDEVTVNDDHLPLTQPLSEDPDHVYDDMLLSYSVQGEDVMLKTSESSSSSSSSSSMRLRKPSSYVRQ